MDCLANFIYKLLHCNDCASWFSAVGTIAATIAAIYFGLTGNYETKLLLRKKNNELDIRAFNFLTQIPRIITGHLDDKTRNGEGKETSRQFIDDFRGYILENNIFGNKKLKKCNYYLKLAEEYSYRFNIKADEKTFYKIKSEAENLIKAVDDTTRLSGMRVLWQYESEIFWNQNIFMISPDKDKYPFFLIFINKENKSKIREIIQEDWESEGNSEKIYLDEDGSIVSELAASDYELIKKTEKNVEIIYKGKKISLDYEKPERLKMKYFWVKKS